MTAHTPGPWRPSLYSSIGVCGVVAKRGILVAAILGDKATSEANARLIACAPDLLAMVERYASECEDCNGTGRAPAFADNVPGDITKGVHEVEVDCDACADIRLVIEKAEGGA